MKTNGYLLPAQKQLVQKGTYLYLPPFKKLLQCIAKDLEKTRNKLSQAEAETPNDFKKISKLKRRLERITKTLASKNNKQSTAPSNQENPEYPMDDTH